MSKPKIPRIASRAARVARYGATLILIGLAGCAAQTTRDDAQESTRGDKDAASQLYAGQPTVVHATEFPVESAAEGVQRGDEAWRQGKFDLAVYLYVQSLAYDATSAGPFLKIGAIHERLGNRQLAQRAFEFALEREPDNAGASERLGLLYLQSNRYDAAQALFQRAITLDTDRWQSHNGLGIVADQHSDFVAAIGHYNTAFVLAPGAATVVNNRGYSRYLSGDLAGAEADLREAIRLGALAGTWMNLGKVQAKQAQYAQALESFLKETDLAQAHYLVGAAAMESGDLFAAQKHFTLAISAAPRHFQAAQDMLALVKERIAEAENHPTKVARSDTSIYAKGAVIGKVTRGLQVSVLHTQGVYSLVKYRDPRGTDLTGWVPSANLGDSVRLQ